MTWADVTYGVWALVAASATLLWVAAGRGWRVGRWPLRRPSGAVRDLLTHGWARVPILLGWLWLGWHFFAR